MLVIKKLKSLIVRAFRKLQQRQTAYEALRKVFGKHERRKFVHYFDFELLEGLGKTN